MTEPYKKIRDNTWLITVQENGKDKELYLQLPQEAIDQIGWSEGDSLAWTQDDNGISWTISKKDNT